MAMTSDSGDVLVHTDGQGSCAWAGLRLTPVGGLEATHDYRELNRSQREERVADAESDWLAAQWTASGPARFEIRYRTLPDSGRIECALLCRVQVATPDAAVRAAHTDRDRLAADLPKHVRAEAIVESSQVYDWLAPFGAPAEDGQIEIVKDLAWQPAVRRDTGRPLSVVVAPFSIRRASWEPVLRELARLPFRAILSVGFAPFNPTPSFRLRLAELAREYAVFARSAVGSAVYSVSAPPDPFAARAASSFAAYVRKYTAAMFQVRVSLAAEGALPGRIGEGLARLLSGADADSPGRAVALRPAAHERAMAWNNLGTLSADWLPDTYRRGLSDAAFGATERTLMTLVDAAEARSVLQFPTAWPEREPLFEPVERRVPDDFG
jgi:hypothetical protein